MEGFTISLLPHEIAMKNEKGLKKYRIKVIVTTTCKATCCEVLYAEGWWGKLLPIPLVVCHRVLYVRYHFRLRVAPYFFAATEEREKHARSLENHPTQKSRDVAGIRRAHFFHGEKITLSLSLPRKTHLILLYFSRVKFFCFYHLIH